MASQEFINNFSGGMFKDTSLLNQPEGTYRDLKNFEVVTHDGNTFSVKDSLGNRLVLTIPLIYSSVGPPVVNQAPMMPIGFISLPDRLIVFSTNSETDAGSYGEIGEIYLTNIGQSVEAQDQTLTIGPNIGNYTYSGYVPLYGHTGLKFSKMHKIEGFGFKENDAIERVYWTDNNNQPRVFDISDATYRSYFDDGDLVTGTEYMVLGGVVTHSAVDYGPGMTAGNVFTSGGGTPANYTVVTGSPLVIPYVDYEILNFTPSRALGQIMFDDLGTGTKYCGNHMYFYRLSKSTSGQVTSWSYGSFPVHVGKNQDYPTTPTINTNHNYVGHGSTASLVNSGKSVQLKITNIDTKYDTIELACAEFDQDYEVPYRITIVATKGVNSSTLNSDGSIDMEDFGNVNLGTLTLDDITLFPANVLKCKTLTTNKNYILAGNITEREEFDAIDFTDVTPSDFIYYMPVDRDIDYESALNVPAFPMTAYAPFTPNVNPSTIYPEVKYTVTSVAGGNVTYNAVSYGLNEVFVGVVGTTAVTIPGASQVRLCFAWEQYNPVNNTNQRKNIVEAKTVLGASGDTELNYRNPAAAMHLKSYRSSETYRFGILFYDKRGNPFYVRWLCDHTFTDIYTKDGLLHDVGGVTPYNSLYCLTPNGFQLDDLRIPRAIVDQISGFSIVRAECDKTILTQGLLWQTSYSQPSPGQYEIHPLPGYSLQATQDSYGPINGQITYSYICPDSLSEFRGFQQAFAPGDKLRVVGWLDPVDFGAAPGVKYAWWHTQADDAWSKLYTHIDAADTSTNESTIVNIQGMNEADTVVNIIGGGDFYNARMWFGASGANEAVYNNWSGGGPGDWQASGASGFLMVGGRKLGVVFDDDLYNHQGPAGGVLYSASVGGVPANPTVFYKALTNYVIDKPNQYGGTGEDAKAATTYISTGHFQPINSTVIADNYVGGTGVTDYDYLQFNELQVFGGDTFLNLVDQGYGLYNTAYVGFAYDGSTAVPAGWGLFFPCENQVNYDLRNGRKVSDFGMHESNYGVTYSGVGAAAPTNCGLEDYAYNDAYSSDGTPFAYAALPVNYVNAGRFPFRIRFAGEKFPGELVDSFRVFLTNDYKDVDGGLGEINNLRSKEGKTFYFQNHGIGYVPILERQTVSATAGEATTLGTGGVVDRFDTISAVYGNQHQWSLTDTVDGFIWFDMRNKAVIVMTPGGGVKEITTPLGLRSFFSEVFLERVTSYYGGTFLNSPTYDATSDQPLLGTGIISVYDPKTKTSYLTFKFKEWTQEVSDVATAESSSQYQVISKDFTVAYSHVTGKFIGFYDKCPAIWHNHNQVVLSANNPKNIQKYYAADMYVPADFELGDVICVGEKEYICTTAGTVSAYAATPSASLFTLINQTNQIYVENEEKAYTVNIEGYEYNKYYGRVVNNEIEVVVNPKSTEPSVFDNFIMSSNNVNFTDVTVETTDQTASDLSITLSNRDYQYTDKAWRSSLPISATGRMVDYFLKATFTKKNWTTDPTTVATSVKILNFIKTIFRISK